MEKSHYEVLGIDRGASPEEVRAAYQLLARLMHPDRCGGTKEANDAFASVTCAYSVLSDPKRRKVYDATLELLTDVCKKCDGKGRWSKQKGFGMKRWTPCDVCKGTGRINRK